MIDKIKTINGVPDPFVPNAEKDSDAYGLKWAKHIYYDWFESDGNRFNDRRCKFEEERSYLNNEVNINKFKDILGINQDKSWVAIDWSMIPIVSKFVNTIVDGFYYDMFTITAKGTDLVSIQERKDYRNNIEIRMLSKDFGDYFNSVLGLPQGQEEENLPETQDELDYVMDSEFKLDKEIATEIITDKVLSINDWKEIHNRITQDIVTHGIGVTKNEIDSQIGIKQLYVDPINFLYSYDPYKTRDKRGCFYFAELKSCQLSDIQNQSNGKFSQEELIDMAISSNDDYRRAYEQDREGFRQNYLDLSVDIMKFCFKTTRNEVYKEKYKGKLVTKDDTWELHPDSRSKKVQGTYDVWYEGIWVTSTEYIYNYQLISKMIRDPKDINKVLPPYTVYQINTPSIVRTIIPFADDMQVARLKIQHLIAQAKPQGVSIDVVGLTDVASLNGGNITPLEAAELYSQTGNLLWSSRNYEGERNPLPIQDIPHRISSDLQQFMNSYNMNLQMIYDSTGINRVRDGSVEQQRSSVGGMNLALDMSNAATRNILNATLSILERVSENIIARFRQMSLLEDRFKEKLIGLIGTGNERALKGGEYFHNFACEFDIQIEPDASAKANFKEYLKGALSIGAIEIPDAIDLEQTKNIKLASKYLKIRIEKRKREMQALQERQIQIQEQARAQAQIAIQQANNQAEQQRLQMEQAKMQFEGQKEAMLMGRKYEFDVLMENLKFQHEMALKGAEVESNKELNKFKEKAKDDRTKLQATQQSKMIDQRNKDSAPIDFEQQGAFDEYLQQQQAPPMEVMPEQQPMI